MVCFLFLKVCPIFGAPLIKRVLDYFTPDEFCPDPIPDVVLEALESEVSLYLEPPYIAKDFIANKPNNVTPCHGLYSHPLLFGVALVPNKGSM